VQTLAFSFRFRLANWLSESKSESEVAQHICVCARLEEEERLRHEEEEERAREAEELRLAEESRKAEEERLRQAVAEEQKRRELEEQRLEAERQQVTIIQNLLMTMGYTLMTTAYAETKSHSLLLTTGQWQHSRPLPGTTFTKLLRKIGRIFLCLGRMHIFETSLEHILGKCLWQGDHSHGKPEKVWVLQSHQEKVRKNWKKFNGRTVNIRHICTMRSLFTISF